MASYYNLLSAIYYKYMSLSLHAFVDSLDDFRNLILENNWFYKIIRKWSKNIIFTAAIIIGFNGRQQKPQKVCFAALMKWSSSTIIFWAFYCRHLLHLIFEPGILLPLLEIIVVPWWVIHQMLMHFSKLEICMHYFFIEILWRVEISVTTSKYDMKLSSLAAWADGIMHDLIFIAISIMPRKWRCEKCMLILSDMMRKMASTCTAILNTPAVVYASYISCREILTQALQQ